MSTEPGVWLAGLPDTPEVGMEDWEFQHTIWALLVIVSTSVAKGKGDNGYHGYSIILWGVLGCSRIYAAFPFFLPLSLQNSWLVCAFLLLFPPWCPSHVAHTKANHRTEVSNIYKPHPATTFPERRNVMFALAFQKSFNKMKLSAVVLLRYVPLFAGTCSSRTSEFTRAACQLWPCNVEMKQEEVINFSFLQGRKITSRMSLQRSGRQLGPQAHLSHQEKKKNPKRKSEGAKILY